MNCRNDRCFTTFPKELSSRSMPAIKNTSVILAISESWNVMPWISIDSFAPPGSKAKHHNDGKHGNSEHSVNPGQIFRNLPFRTMTGMMKQSSVDAARILYWDIAFDTLSLVRIIMLIESSIHMLFTRIIDAFR